MIHGKIFIATHTIVLISFPLIMSEKYKFYLFENFEMTKHCFIKEQHIVQALQRSRQDLHYTVHELNRWIYTSRDSLPALGSDTQQEHYQNVKTPFFFTLRLLNERYQHLRNILIWRDFPALYPKTKEN